MPSAILSKFFGANFVPSFRIVCLKWGLLPKLIRICRIQWWCSLFVFCKFGSKNWNCQFTPKFSTWTNFNLQNSMVIFTFFVFDRKYSFRENLIQKIQIFSLSSNLVSRLIWIFKIQWGCSLLPFSTKNTHFG